MFPDRFLKLPNCQIAKPEIWQFGHLSPICDLDQPYRLIFEPHENPIPANEHGQYIWLKIAGIEIIEIVNYHKEI